MEVSGLTLFALAQIENKKSERNVEVNVLEASLRNVRGTSDL